MYDMNEILKDVIYFLILYQLLVSKKYNCTFYLVAAVTCFSGYTLTLSVFSVLIFLEAWST